ncbi:MAG: hypothetical protein M1816_007280 [Peltula sp. TS41687]|nr:MAG: hypothetical protein M1816_007280 [Peltula sp. TS41687]
MAAPAGSSAQLPKTDGKRQLVRRDVMGHLLDAYIYFERLHARYARWRIARNAPRVYDDDIVVIVAPDGKEVYMTFKQRRLVDGCRALMTKRKASAQEIFDQCREYALNPNLGLEHLDYGPSESYADDAQAEGSQADHEQANHAQMNRAQADHDQAGAAQAASSPGGVIKPGHNNNDNNHFSKAPTDQARQLIQTFGEKVKNTIPSVMAPLVAAEKNVKNSGLIGLGAAPRMPTVQPL